MVRICLILFVSFLIHFQPFLFSQANEYKANEYKIENVALPQGVSQNLIFTIYQDSKGFIWFGTMFGLVRYDGSNIVTYRYDPADTNSLSNDDVVSIYEDKQGYLWIGTYKGGLNRYDRAAGTFARFIHKEKDKNSISENTIWSVYQDNNSTLWFGTDGGLNKFENGKFSVFSHDPANQKSIGSNIVLSITEDKSGNLWIGTAFGGLNKMDRSTGTFTIYKRDSLNVNSISGNYVRSLYCDNDGILWAGTLQKGLNLLDTKTGEFKKYVFSPDDEFSISDNSIISIAPAPNGDVWLATTNGINRYEKSSGKFYRINLLSSPSSAPQTANSICLDNSGVLWTTLYNNGLYKLYKNNNKIAAFKHSANDINSLSGNDVLSAFEDSHEQVWIGTENGLNKYNKSDNTFTHFIPPVEKNIKGKGYIISSIFENSKDILLIGTNAGLYKFDRDKNTFEKDNDVSVPQILKQENITRIFESSDSNMWIGTANGLVKYDHTTDVYKIFTNDPADTNTLSSDYILSVYEDRNHEIWIGTYTGLDKLDKSGKITRYRQDPYNEHSISNNYAFCFTEDNENNLWIGTGGGLNKLNRQNGTFTYYTEKEGLPNSVICGLVTDAKGNLWISTHNGISQFDIKTNTFKDYDISDGLQGKLFNTGSAYRQKTGDIIFGGTEGFNIFNPSQIEENKFIPSIVFTNFTKYSESSKEVKDISGINNIELSYKDNIIEIQYASLDYTNPAKNQYAYKLEGFENSWQYTGNSTKAVFTNLNPGTYTFRVKGTNSDGVWNEAGNFITIKITPPYWKTWWFYLLISIAFLALIAGSYNYRIKQQVKALLDIELAKEIEREKVRDQASRDYHDELGHKLTRISIYTRRIKKKLGSNANGLTHDLENIVDTSNSLQSGAKDLIWSLNPQEDTLYDLAVRLKDFGNSLFDNSEIKFTMNEIPESFKKVSLTMNSKRHLVYIFKEGMNNILKYADSTIVNLSIEYQKGEVTILLEDNGIGFDNNDNSKGYGLKNIAVRTKQINGVVNITSEKNKGTTIKLVTSL